MDITDNGFLLSDFTDRYEFIRKLNGIGEAADPDSPLVLKTDGTKAYWSDGGGLGGGSLWQLSDAETGEENENALSGQALVYDKATEKWKNADLYYHDGYYFPNAVQDYDGNWYGAVIIGDQVWMAENLRATKYYDSVTGNTYDLTRKSGGDTAEDGLYYYDVSDTSSMYLPIRQRGYFYSRAACYRKLLYDDSWGIPARNDADKLIAYLNANHRHLCGGIQGNTACALACDVDYWYSSNVPHTPGYAVITRPDHYHNNSSGFNAYPTRWEISNERKSAVFRLYDNEYSQANFSLAIYYNFVDAETNGVLSPDVPVSLRYLYGGTARDFVNRYVNEHGTMQYTGLWQLADTGIGDYADDDMLGGQTLVYNRFANTWYNEDLCYHDGYYFPNAVQDLDGNWYGAVVIGDQVWMAENLRATKYYDEQDSTVKDLQSYNSYNSFIAAGSTKRYLHITNISNPIPLKASGYLYDNLTARNVFNNLFSGWVLPRHNNVNKLFTYLNKQGKYLNYGSEESPQYRIAKAISSANTNYWSSFYQQEGCPTYQPEQNNKSGFNAVPFFYNNDPNYIYQGHGTGISRDGFQIWMASNASGVSGQYNYIRGQANERYVTYYMTDDYHEPKSVRLVYNGTVAQFRDWYVEQYGTMQHHIGGGGGGVAGTLTTTSAAGLTTQTNESFSGDIQLHKIAKTGSWNDLINKPAYSARGSDFDVLGYYAGGINIGNTQTDFIINPARPVFLNGGDYVSENQGVVRPLFEVNRSGCDVDDEEMSALNGGVHVTPDTTTQICTSLNFGKETEVTLLPIVCIYRKNPLLSTKKGNGEYRYESIPCVAIPTALYENGEFGFSNMYANILGFPACTPK